MSLPNQTSEADDLFNQGIDLYTNKEYGKAIEAYQAAFQIYGVINEQLSMAQVLNAIGVTQNALKNYSEAVNYYLQALDILKALGGQRDQEGRELNNLGIAYDYLGQYSEALDCYQQALLIFHETNNAFEQGSVINNLHYSQYLQQHFEQALDGFLNALKIHQATNNAIGKEITLRNIRSSTTRLLREPPVLSTTPPCEITFPIARFSTSLLTASLNPVARKIPSSSLAGANH